MKSTRNEHRTTVLLAGFEAFPGAPANPTEHLVHAFDGAALAQGARVERLVLPVEWGRSWQVLAARIDSERPDAVLLFGLHAKSERFRIEMTGFNERATDRPDAAGRHAETLAIAPGPRTAGARLPLEALGRELSRAGIDFEISEDAGRYLCNETLYHLCREGRSFGLRYFGFIHTPLTDECADEIERRGLPAPAAEGRTVSAASLSRLAVVAIECLSRQILQDRAKEALTSSDDPVAVSDLRCSENSKTAQGE